MTSAMIITLFIMLVSFLAEITLIDAHFGRMAPRVSLPNMDGLANT